jgi:hypothetical protein
MTESNETRVSPTRNTPAGVRVSLTSDIEMTALICLPREEV